MSRSYIVSDVLPAHELSLLSGSSNIGKTFLMYYLLDRFRAGRDWFGHLCHTCPFAYIVTDRPSGDCEEKFVKLGMAPWPILSLLSLPDYRPLQLANGEKRTAVLDALWRQVEVPELLVLDPISVFLPSDMKNYHRLADALVEITRWCQRNHVTILGVHHAAKQASDKVYARAIDRALGSGGGLNGYLATPMFLTGDEEVENKPGHYEFEIHPHNSPRQTVKLARTAVGSFTLWEEVPENNAKEIACYLNLAELIPYEPLGIELSDLIRAASDKLHVSRESVKRYLKQLAELNIVTKLRHGVYSRVKSVVS